MRDFFTFFYEQRGGIFVFIGCLIFVAILLRYLAWTFGWGRFKRETPKTVSGVPQPSDGHTGFVVAEFFANLINDFRHLLALILVLIFASVLVVAISVSEHNPDALTKAIQGVTATLGGLIGSIIGYYFGESAARRSQAATTTVAPAGPPIQSSGGLPGSPPVAGAPITAAPAPPPAG